MQYLQISLNEIIEHADKINADDYSAITVIVDVNIDGELFNLNFQSTTDVYYNITKVFALNNQSEDMQKELAALFDSVDSDGDIVKGCYSKEYENIVSLAQTIAQAAADEFFDNIAKVMQYE